MFSINISGYSDHDLPCRFTHVDSRTAFNSPDKLCMARAGDWLGTGDDKNIFPGGSLDRSSQKTTSVHIAKPTASPKHSKGSGSMSCFRVHESGSAGKFRPSLLVERRLDMVVIDSSSGMCYSLLRHQHRHRKIPLLPGQ